MQELYFFEGVAATLAGGVIEEKEAHRLYIGYRGMEGVSGGYIAVRIGLAVVAVHALHIVSMQFFAAFLGLRHGQ